MYTDFLTLGQFLSQRPICCVSATRISKATNFCIAPRTYRLIVYKVLAQ